MVGGVGQSRLPELLGRDETHYIVIAARLIGLRSFEQEASSFSDHLDKKAISQRAKPSLRCSKGV